jgi:DNA-binding NarL/FixJ family response regulator
MLAYTYSVLDSGWVDIQAFTEEGPKSFVQSFMAGGGPDEIQKAVASAHLRSGLTSISLVMQPHCAHGPFRDYVDRLVVSNGLRDFLFVRSIDPTRSGCAVGIGVDARSVPPRSPTAHWNRLTGHIAAGLRLRRKLAAIERAPDAVVAPAAVADVSPEAVLQPGGRVEHAEGQATSRSARDSLSTAARAMDRARGSLRRRDAGEAVEIWRGLVAGRWSLIDHFDSDGRRYLVAHRNDPATSDPRALTDRERQVLGYADLGRSNKMIAYELGLSPSTVAVLLGRAREKLRCAP